MIRWHLPDDLFTISKSTSIKGVKFLCLETTNLAKTPGALSRYHIRLAASLASSTEANALEPSVLSF
jgi:hypothetical protein